MTAPPTTREEIQRRTDTGATADGLEIRVWWIPQVPHDKFLFSVPTLEAGKQLCAALAKYDLFQFEHRIKPDYCSAGGIEWRHPGSCDGDWQGIDENDDFKMEDAQREITRVTNGGIFEEDGNELPSAWPEAVSDGLTLACSDCAEVPRFDYKVTEKFWALHVPEKPARLGVVCLPCLDLRCGGVGLADALVEIQWTGTKHTVVLKPILRHVYGCFHCHTPGEPGNELSKHGCDCGKITCERCYDDYEHDQCFERAQANALAQRYRPRGEL